MENLSYTEIRKFASLKCQNNASKLAIIYLIYSFLTLSLNIDTEKYPEFTILVFITSVMGLVFSGPMEYGLSKVIKLNYHNADFDSGTLFDGFKGKVYAAFFLQVLYLIGWFLLLIIPGIINSIAYSMTYYVMLDNPELSANECIRKSKELMRGHKSDLFVLLLSYIGWLLLSLLTFGILMLWVGPKMQTAKYHFYLKIQGREEKEVLNF